MDGGSLRKLGQVKEVKLNTAISECEGEGYHRDLHMGFDLGWWGQDT